MQYVSKVFLDFHDPTIEDVFQTQTVVDGEAGIVDILDTAGQVRKSNLLNLFSPRCWANKFFIEHRCFVTNYSLKIQYFLQSIY